MIGDTTLSFSFDTNGEHQFQLQVLVTETQTSNPLGIEICRQKFLKLHFELPAKELKNTANAISYGKMYSKKPYPFVSKKHTVKTPH